MPRVRLTRLVEFSATHRIRRADLSPADNAGQFGRAAADHAHRYTVAVTVSGPLDAARGGVVPLAELDALLAREVTTRFDGRHINEDIPEFRDGGRLATGEALAVYLWDRLAPGLPAGVRLETVRVQEGPHLYSEYSGDA